MTALERLGHLQLPVQPDPAAGDQPCPPASPATGCRSGCRSWRRNTPTRSCCGRARLRGGLPAADAGGAARGYVPPGLTWPDRMLGSAAPSGRGRGGAPSTREGISNAIVHQGHRAARGGVGGGARRAAEAKTLVYCSEGSPEGFNPMLFTAGTTFDATLAPGLQPAGRVRARDTKTMPGLAESLTVSDDGLTSTPSSCARG